MEGKEGRTERATGKRRGEERRKGHMTSSQEVISFAVLFAALVALRLSVPFMYEQLCLYLQNAPRLFTAGPLSVPSVQDLFEKTSLLVGAMVMPLVGATTLAVIASNVGQHGLFFETEPLEWKISGLNPFRGLRNLFSLSSLVSFGFSFVKVALIASVLYFGIRKRIPEFTFLAQSSVLGSAVWMFGLLYDLALRVVVLYAIVAVVDYLYQYRKFERGIMMTKEEVKDERKQYEPNPVIKKAQRKKMREVTMLRMMAAVPRATVIVTNPTHVAVALEYDPETMDAPKVTAKGLRLVAERIKDLAREHGVPILERPDLARALYKDVEVGREIPGRFYEAVAEILAYLHRLGRRVFPVAETARLAV